MNDFFISDCLKHENLLLAKTYVLTLKGFSIEDTRYPFALISFCNDAIRKEKVQDIVKKIPEQKRYKDLPAVKIARLGVQKEHQGTGIGATLINMVKEFFLRDNRTGCRILTVDAYNTPDVLAFYQRMQFDFLSDKDKRKETRSMFYDLMDTALEHANLAVPQL
ncbi:MAG: GNAT family N-acetyltransferase [Deltaproteobacteria bacterium]|nr:GNAT family N-acetyltransferase [Deltaproteobacteria bacterium]